MCSLHCRGDKEYSDSEVVLKVVEEANSRVIVEPLHELPRILSMLKPLRAFKLRKVEVLGDRGGSTSMFVEAKKLFQSFADVPVS